MQEGEEGAAAQASPQPAPSRHLRPRQTAFEGRKPRGWHGSGCLSDDDVTLSSLVLRGFWSSHTQCQTFCPPDITSQTFRLWHRYFLLLDPFWLPRALRKGPSQGRPRRHRPRRRVSWVEVQVPCLASAPPPPGCVCVCACGGDGGGACPAHSKSSVSRQTNRGMGGAGGFSPRLRSRN